MVYDVTDHYTFSNEIVIPIEADDIDIAEYTFGVTCLETKEKRDKSNYRLSPDFNLFGRTFDCCDFFDNYTEGDEDKMRFHEPKFYELNDWWEKNL